jgi:hypothetical protein
VGREAAVSVPSNLFDAGSYKFLIDKSHHCAMFLLNSWRTPPTEYLSASATGRLFAGWAIGLHLLALLGINSVCT